MRKLLLTMIIWIMSFSAITASIVLCYEIYKNRGVDITIQFDDASGLVPGESKIIYLGVQAGVVKNIEISAASEYPIIKARVTKQIASMLGSGSRFWIVSPSFEVGKISNLSAISTGDYIAVEPKPGTPTKHFVAYDNPIDDPTITKGLKFMLHTSDATGLNVGSEIFYRGVQIGEIGDMDFSKDYKVVKLTIYIFKKFHGIIRKSSYFTNVSGFHTTFSLFGTSYINMDSFKTLVSGGINVYSPNMDSPVAKPGEVFKLLTAKELQELRDS